MEFKLSEQKTILSDEEILSDIRQVSDSIGCDYISLTIYRKNGKYSYSAIRHHFGTWKNALNLAGLRTEKISVERKVISDEDYYLDLKRVSKIISSETVPYSEYERFGKYSANHIIRRFGTWDNVLESAGLRPTGLSLKRISEKDLFDEIERLWRHLGRQPTTTDIVKRKMSKYSIDTYKRRFGSFRKALEAFVFYINQVADEDVKSQPCEDQNNTTSQQDSIPITHSPTSNSAESESIPVVPLHRTSRNVGVGLRFKVLLRDNFKCCCCGASPAKDPSIELHVDHRKPWAKGGETTLDNLQTLCSKCNAGKSDITIE